MDETIISEWANSRDVAARVAASLAKKIQDGRYRQYQQLPPNADLASEYDVSITTVLRAKRMLARHSVLAKDDSRIYVVT
jgi:DNA-binding GntR family transcriptional regulator